MILRLSEPSVRFNPKFRVIAIFGKSSNFKSNELLNFGLIVAPSVTQTYTGSIL